MTPDEIRKAIGEIPQNKPNEDEGIIREIDIQISKLQDASEKEKLFSELRAVACLGLHEDLKKMIEVKGLRLEAIHLVVKYLTNVPELAEYLDKNSGQPELLEEAELEIVSRRLGPDLEVLGALSARGIDVSKEWVTKLCKRAPSLQALTRLRLRTLEECCQGADEGDMDEVHSLVEKAESHGKQLNAIPQDETLVQKDKETKGVDEEKLKKVRELMIEAKTMAEDQSESSKTTVNEKLAMIMNTLELPSEWMKQDEVKPDQLFQRLDEIIEQCSNVVESAESYRSEVEIITKASAGRALCGIYHSEYEKPEPAGRPLLLVPRLVTLTNPNSAQELNYMKFSAKGVAADYVKTVESSSTNIGFGVAGFYGLFVGEVQGGVGHEQTSQADHSIKTSTTSASVLQYIRTAKKTFQLEPDQINISLTARKMAKSIAQEKSTREKSARLFMRRYGSHYPAGVQTLGGVFFSIADAESKSTTDTFKLTQAAVDHLKAQISVGFLSGAFGIGASVTGEHTTSKGSSKGIDKASDNETFTYSVKSMGPLAANPATFNKLLSYNSTWSLIDRGSFQGYIPVWELIRELGKEFEESALVLEETWNKDETARKEKWEEWQKKLRDAQIAEQKRREGEEEMKNAREELLHIKDEHLTRDAGISKGHWPTNGKLIFTQDWMKHADAYDKGVELIMQDPRHNICEITWWYHIAGSGYTLKCWTASDDTPTTFGSGGGEHVLFFSELLFKWKNKVPRRG